MRTSADVSLADLILDPTQRSVEPRPGQIGYVRMFFVPGSLDEANRTMRFTFSHKSVDRYGEMVDPEAFRKWLPTYQMNPIVMAGHVYVSPDGAPTSVGNVIDIAIIDDGLEGTIKFMVATDALAESYWARYRDGVQRSVSVGFIAHEHEMRELELDGVTQRVRVHTEVELVEISLTAIPAQREALVRAASAFTRPVEKTSDAALAVDSKALEKTIEKKLDQLLDAVPGSRLGVLVEDVVEVTLARLGSGVQDDFGDAPGPAPGTGPQHGDPSGRDWDQEEADDPELTEALRRAIDESPS